MAQTILGVDAAAQKTLEMNTMAQQILGVDAMAQKTLEMNTVVYWKCSPSTLVMANRFWLATGLFVEEGVNIRECTAVAYISFVACW